MVAHGSGRPCSGGGAGSGTTTSAAHTELLSPNRNNRSERVGVCVTTATAPGAAGTGRFRWLGRVCRSTLIGQAEAVMTRHPGDALAVFVAVSVVGCTSTAEEPSPSSAAYSPEASGPVTRTVATPTDGPTGNLIPVVNRAADSGCLDDRGNLRAAVRGWYPGPTGSALGLNGERRDSAALRRFQRAAAEAVAEVAPSFDIDGRSELQATSGGCVTHRYASFASGADQIVVSAWRVESAADPYWVPNEKRFRAVD